MDGSTAAIVALQRREAVRMACRAMGLRGTTVGYPVTGIVRFTFLSDTSWTYEQLQQVAEAVGTRDISFEYESAQAGTEVTPGDQAEVAMVFRWPRARSD